MDLYRKHKLIIELLQQPYVSKATENDKYFRTQISSNGLHNIILKCCNDYHEDDVPFFLNPRLLSFSTLNVPVPGDAIVTIKSYKRSLDKLIKDLKESEYGNDMIIRIY